jgi:polar amino acid transport system substrate-binding protein
MKTLPIISMMLCFFSTNTYANKTLIFSTAEESTIQDISIQVLTEAYHKIGYDIQVRRLPNRRSLLAANRGTVDGEISRIKGINNRFGNLIRIPIAINFLEGQAFSKKTHLTIKNWNDLPKYKLLCVRGVKFVEAKLQKLNIPCHFVNLFTDAVKMLQINRYDIAIFPKINGITAIKKARIKNVKPIGKPLSQINLYHYLHSKNKSLITSLRKTLEEMNANGRITTIRQKYIEKHTLQD